jgi:hypothetical protein
LGGFTQSTFPPSSGVLHELRAAFDGAGATMLTGATRCINRMKLLRGDTVKMRYRRLDFECTRTKTESSIAISRGADE